MNAANYPSYPIRDIAFHDQPAGALFVGTTDFRAARRMDVANWKIKNTLSMSDIKRIDKENAHAICVGVWCMT
jgi:hypothetical protein